MTYTTFCAPSTPNEPTLIEPSHSWTQMHKRIATRCDANIVNLPSQSPPPHNFSALHSGTQNLWGTLSHHYRRHHLPQLPLEPPTPIPTTQDPWVSCCRRHFHSAQKTVHLRPALDPSSYSCHLKRHQPRNPPLQPHQPVQCQPPAHVFQAEWYPHGILPTKSKNFKKISINSEKI